MKSIIVCIFSVAALSGCSVAVDSGTVVDKRYQIKIEDSQGNDENHYVTKEEFDSVEVGDFFDTEAQ